MKTVEQLRKFLSESLSKLEGVDGSLPVTGVRGIEIQVNNVDGYDVNFEGEEDKTPNFVHVNVQLRND